jgi:hypothetical protein
MHEPYSTINSKELFSIMRRRVLDGMTLEELMEAYGVYATRNFLDSVMAGVDYSKETPTPSTDLLFARSNELSFANAKDILRKT